MKWSEEVWALAQPIYNKILSHPFVKELADGSLDRNRFLFYIHQDAIYIDNYSRVLAHIASRLPEKKQIEDFLRFASDGIQVEKALHESFIGNDSRPASPTPGCLLYTSYETAKGFGPVEIEAAAILPCFWVYQRVGETILAESKPDNPYHRWIATYGDPAFAESTLRAVEICDELARKTTLENRELMTEAFLTATRMEWMFWDSAYYQRQWNV